MASQEQLLDRLDSAERRASRLRDKARTAVEDAVVTVATVSGGAVAGFLDAKYYDTRPLGIGIPLLAGSGLTVIGLMGWAGRQSRFVGAVGSGLLTSEAYKAVYQRSKPNGGGSSGYLGAGYVGQQFAPAPPAAPIATAPPMTMDQLLQNFQALQR